VYLLPGVLLDEAWKYALAAIATFLLAAAIEGVRVLRVRVRAGRKEVIRASDLLHMRSRVLVITHVAIQRYIEIDTVYYAVQMVLAYAAMLIVMSYDVIMIMCVVLGLAVGHYCCERYTAKVSAFLALRVRALQVIRARVPAYRQQKIGWLIVHMRG
jgi:hypothetical protein